MSFFEENRKYILSSLIILLLLTGFVGGYLFSRSGYAIEAFPIRFVSLNKEKAPAQLNWEILWQAMDAIKSKYVDKSSIDPQALLYGAVSGMVGSLGDPYSVFFSPTKSQEFQQDLKGEFDGIGAEIGIRQNQLMIIAPLEGSPAEAAGLKPLDKILQINGESTEKLALDEAVNKIRGPKGSAVNLTITRDGFKEPKKLSIVRDKIVVKSVTSEVKEQNGVKIGIIKLKRFGEDTEGDLDKAITSLLKENIKGVVLDMRSNPGGYITVAVQVASNWVKESDVVVSEQFGDGTKNDYKASGVSRLAGLPTVVLVNEGSASASEIVAGALHDHNLGILVGKKTFGKGSVQELVNLPDGTDLKITIAKWLTPSGKNINVEGIKPDVEVDLSEEDLNAFRDPQMDKGIEYLLEKTK